MELDLPTDECTLVLACDGLWDVLSSEEVAQIVGDSEEAGADVHALAVKLRDFGYSMNSFDNISVAIVKFRDKKGAKPFLFIV